MKEKEIITIDPFRCRPWQYHDRLEQEIDENSCRAEIESFLRFGQLVPALGRRVHGDPDHDVEIICGARRRFVAMHLNKPLVVEIRQLTDLEGVVAMDIENRHRMDVSPYERGMSFRRYLHDGLFKSQDEIARKLNISAAQVSRLLKLAHLPSVIVAAFAHPSDIREIWANDLTVVLDDPQSRAPTCARSRAIAQMRVRPAPRDILRLLLAASVPGRKPKVPKHDEVVSDRNGKPLFRIRRLTSNLVIALPLVLPASRLAQIRSALVNILEEERLASLASREHKLVVSANGSPTAPL